MTILSTPYFIRDFHRVRNAKFPFTNERSALVLSLVYSFIRREIPFEISLLAAFAIISLHEGDDCTSIMVCSRSIDQQPLRLEKFRLMFLIIWRKVSGDCIFCHNSIYNCFGFNAITLVVVGLMTAVFERIPIKKKNVNIQLFHYNCNKW